MKRFLLFSACFLLLFSCRKTDQTSSASTVTDYSEADTAPVAVELLIAEKDKLVPYIELSGAVRGINEVNLLSQSGGTVEEVYATLGGSIAKGEPLLKLDDTLAYLQMEAAAAQAATAKIEADALEELYKKGGSSKKDNSAAKNKLAAAKAAYEAARQSYENCTLRSPVNGVIATLKRTVSPGNTLQAGTVVARIIDNSSWVVETSVGEGQVGLVSEGMTAYISVNSAGTSREEGIITAIASGGDLSTGSFKIHVEWKSGNQQIRSGMTASVFVPASDKDSRIIIPASSVVRRNRQDYVFLEKQGNAAAAAVVKGKAIGNRLEIISGINEGDHLIISALNSLAPGNPVTGTFIDRNEALQ